MARIRSILERIMLFKVLALILLQGVLACDAYVKSEGVGSGVGVPLSGGPGAPEAAAGPKSRAKRCTCYSYKDKECVYYCHLDIIWINTPERTVPYGMSSYQGPHRNRRAVVGRPAEYQRAESQRCICVLDDDIKCQDFCLPRQRRPGARTHMPARDDTLNTLRFFCWATDPLVPILAASRNIDSELRSKFHQAEWLQELSCAISSNPRRLPTTFHFSLSEVRGC